VDLLGTGRAVNETAV